MLSLLCSGVVTGVRYPLGSEEGAMLFGVRRCLFGVWTFLPRTFSTSGERRHGNELISLFPEAVRLNIAFFNLISPTLRTGWPIHCTNAFPTGSDHSLIFQTPRELSFEALSDPGASYKGRGSSRLKFLLSSISIEQHNGKLQLHTR